jgi:hypothetical protein
VAHPPPSQLLRHRAPALLVDEIESVHDAALTCLGHRRHWHWLQLLDGAAQAAGMLTALLPDGLGPVRVVAAYDDVVLHAPAHDGPVRWTARSTRHTLGMPQLDVVARDPTDDRLLLTVRVTLSAPPSR